MNETMQDTRKSMAIAKTGKYLTFVLGQEEFGLEILDVREIIGLMAITTMPKAPAYVKGVINLRGKIIPIIDLRLKFGMPRAEFGKETCIIVLNVASLLMGIIVDRVSEVLDIHAEQIAPAPQFGAQAQTDIVTGLGKIGEKVKILLNIEKVLTEDTVLTQLADYRQ